MKTATTHETRTHLSRLIREVQNGETVVILSGKRPVAKLTAVAEASRARPRVGTVTSDRVSYEPDAFAPMTPAELDEWGL
ncbi:MAG: type II toxin-antitoxin system Phd/YefM family antitoxin [Spirochaetota bacterium]